MTDVNMKGVISIGAHYGEELEGWMSLGVKDFVMFEPVGQNYVKLHRIISNKKNIHVKLFNIALGNETGRVPIHTESIHQGKSSSILKPKLHLEQYPDIIFDGVEMVEIDKLDNIEYDRERYDYMHVDTQGYELEVLKGGKESLKYINEIVCEVYRAELYEGCPMMQMVSDYLLQQGFSLMSIFWRGMSWGDATYKRI
jgi:FkbM family methyltransferase